MEGAMEMLNKAAELDPTMAEIHLVAGRILLRQGRLEAAIDRLSRATQMSPDIEEAHYLLASAYTRSDRPQMAAMSFAAFQRAKAATQRRSSLTTGFVSGR
jgi:Flp pilus assembly protein TadD